VARAAQAHDLRMHLKMPMQDPMDSLERRLAALLLLSFLALVAMLALPIFVGGVYTHDDLGWLQLPIRYLYQQALNAGENFLWAPQLANGYYLHGEGQAGMYHPLHWLLYRYLSLETAFNIELIVSYLWMFPGMYLMLCRLDLPRHGSLFGAFAFTFSGFNLLHYMHLNEIAVISHIPWLIVATDVVLRTDDRRRLAAAQLSVAVLTGSQLLLGQPQYVWCSALAEGAFVIYRLRRADSWWRLASLALAKLTGGMLGAVQMIPTLDVLSYSIRVNPSWDFVLRFSLHPVNLVQLWSPFSLDGRTLGTFKQEAVLYNGAFGTVALAWLFIRRHNLGQWRPLVLSASSFGALMLVWALGKYGLLYGWLAKLPVIGLFRGPSRYVILVHLAMAILAAVAIADLVGLVRRRERVRWSALWPLAGVAILSVATTVALAWVVNRAANYDWIVHLGSVRDSLIGLALITVATALFIAAARGVRWSIYVIIAWMVIDITVWGILWIWKVPPVSLERAAAAHVEPPHGSDAGRIYSRWNSANVLAMKGYSLSHGYFTFVPTREIDPKTRVGQRLAGVRWILDTEGLQVTSPFAYPHGHGTWVEVTEPMPRVRMVTDAIGSLSVAEDVERIDIAKTALLTRAIELPAGQVGSARIVAERAGFIEVETSSASRQLLILSESYHPGWEATEDGRPIEILPAYGDFQACVVGPGDRRVVFRFRPRSFILGAWISMLGIGLAFASFAFVWARAVALSVPHNIGRTMPERV
jgi:membrane protein YfhO